jgi:hypothetical protein
LHVDALSRDRELANMQPYRQSSLAGSFEHAMNPDLLILEDTQLEQQQNTENLLLKRKLCFLNDDGDTKKIPQLQSMLCACVFYLGICSVESLTHLFACFICA